MITYDDSIALAKKLKELSPAIRGVELFGSIVQKGYGRDADFAILVEETVAKRWWSEERESIRVRWPDALYGQRWIMKKFLPFVYAVSFRNRKKKRLRVAASLLGFNLEILNDSADKIPDFEMFLVPVNWRAGKDLNIDSMGQVTDLIHDCNTLGFLKRIAKDAVTVVGN